MRCISRIPAYESFTQDKLYNISFARNDIATIINLHNLILPFSHWPSSKYKKKIQQSVSHIQNTAHSTKKSWKDNTFSLRLCFYPVRKLQSSPQCITSNKTNTHGADCVKGNNARLQYFFYNCVSFTELLTMCGGGGRNNIALHLWPYIHLHT